MHASIARRAVYNNILETIGNTPIVRINKLAPAGVNVFGKCEYFNPLSSVKDRMAYAIIADAEKKGLLKPGDTVVEATSGNTGIALAMVCAQKGYRFVATMAESFSVERRKVMRALGAKVVLTPAPLGGVGMVRKAEDLAKLHGWFLSRQFENKANADYHATTTAPEILNDFRNTSLDYFVTGYGTGGTFSGTSRVLKAARPDIKIILAEPENAPLLVSGKPQERNPDGTPVGPHPAWTGPHPIQGWTPMFIPELIEDGIKFADKIAPVTGKDAMHFALELAKQEGIFTGVSGGGTAAVALEVAKTAPAGSNIVFMIADTGERYLSTPMMAGIDADMNADEIDIMRSTPDQQMP